MRLLLYNRNFAVLGGAEIFSYDLLKVLAKRHQVTVLTHKHDPSLFPYNNVHLVPTANRFYDNYVKGSALAKQIRGQYDSILMITPRIGFDLGLLKAETPITWHCLEPNRTIFANAFSHQSYVGMELHQKSSIRRHIINPFFAWAERRVAAQTKVLCISNYMIDVVKEALHVKPEVVNLGIVLDKFPFSPVKETHVITYLGREHFLKNTSRLKEAISLVKEKVPDVCYNSVANIKDVTPIYRETQVVAYVPLDEPFGLVPVEANACGRSCVVSNYGGPSEIILDGVNGLHCNPFDVKDIAQKITRLLMNINLCQEMGERGRKRVEENFTIEAIAKRMEEFLG